jgi:hypothetical protein
MERGPKAEQQSSPSLDRVVPGYGYVPGNVEWICTRCNGIKADTTPETLATLYAVADWLYEQYRERGIPCPTRLRPLPCVSEAAVSTSRDRIDGDDGGGGLSQPDNLEQKEGDT